MDQPWRTEGKRSSEALKQVAKLKGQASFSLFVDSSREERDQNGALKRLETTCEYL